MSTVAAPPAKDTYTPLELFGIDRLLDEDERDIAATVRRFVETRLKPNVEDWF
ncbi:MAG: acyl-CoA dehydrogenase, partial [Mycolicibacterium sp.]|nr:acyl-CoA dehydrogenase [Mycolicibacterium sp.]